MLIARGRTPESSVRNGDPVRRDDRLGAASPAIGCAWPWTSASCPTPAGTSTRWPISGSRTCSVRVRRPRQLVDPVTRTPGRYLPVEVLDRTSRSAHRARRRASRNPCRSWHTTATRHSWCRVAVCMPCGWRAPSAAGLEPPVGGPVAQRLAAAFLAGAFLAAVAFLAGVAFLAAVVVLAGCRRLGGRRLGGRRLGGGGLGRRRLRRRGLRRSGLGRRRLLRRRGLGRSRLGRRGLRRRLLGRRAAAALVATVLVAGALTAAAFTAGAAAALLAVFLAAFGTFLAPGDVRLEVGAGPEPRDRRGLGPLALAGPRIADHPGRAVHLLEDTESGDGHLLTGGGLVGDRLGDGIEGAGRLRLVAVEMSRQHLDELSLVHGFPSLGRMSAAATYACTGPR